MAQEDLEVEERQDRERDLGGNANAPDVDILLSIGQEYPAFRNDALNVMPA